jgi:hypothetical protein
VASGEVDSKEGARARSRRRRALWLALVLSFLLSPSSPLAFQDEGHLFTSATVVYTALDPSNPDAGEPLLRPDVARLVAFCTQLPDQTLEYDAVQVMNHHLHLGDPQSRQWLQWVQEDLHALAGNDAGTMRRCAREVVEAVHNRVRDTDGKDPVQVCALGFAVHLFGDAYAHFHFDTMQLYGSPLGHMTDYHEPDLPFYEPDARIPNWELYAHQLRAALGLGDCRQESGAPDCVRLGAVLDAGAGQFQEGKMDRSSTQWVASFFSSTADDEMTRQKRVRTAMRAALDGMGRTESAGFPTTVPDATGGPLTQNQPCMDYVDAGMHVHGGFRLPGFSCDAVWHAYAGQAGAILSSPECRSAFSDDDDWRTALPPDDAGYSDE